MRGNCVSCFVARSGEEGNISGTFFDQQGYQHGFLRHHGRFTQIDVPGAVPHSDIQYELGTGLGTAAAVSNREGEIVGEYADALGVTHGWVLDDGRFHTITIPGQANVPGFGCGAVGINDEHQIVGAYNTLSLPYTHGFLLSCGSVTEIKVPESGGYFGTQANEINNQGDIIGVYSDTADNGHGFVLHHGRYQTIDYPGAPFTECHVINDRGVFTGLYYDFMGVGHGFIATPQ